MALYSYGPMPASPHKGAKEAYSLIDLHYSGEQRTDELPFGGFRQLGQQFETLAREEALFDTCMLQVPRRLT